MINRFPPAGPNFGPKTEIGEIRRLLLELDFGTSLFECGFGSLSIFLVGSFEHSDRGAFNKFLGIGESETGSNSTHRFNDGDFVTTRFSEEHIEFSFLFNRLGVSATTASCGGCDRSCGANAPLLFEMFYQFGGFQDGKLAELFCNFCNV